MKIVFTRKFTKDIANINDDKVKEKLQNIIFELENSKCFEMQNCKKMQGFENFYRIRIANFRLGIEIENETIIAHRFLHRKDIYKFFP